MINKSIIWITITVQIIVICTANNDEPLGRNYRKNFNNYNSQNLHTDNGKIFSTSDTKISSVSYKPESSSSLKFGSFVDSSNLRTAASEKEEEKFSIGLGVLSPSYSQKFGEDGKTKLDFNSDKGGFSYSLTNVVHPQQPGSSSSTPTSVPIATNTLNKVQSAGFVPSSYYNPSPQTNPQVNIYHKQSADPIYGRLSGSNNYPIPPSPTPSSPYSAANPLANGPLANGPSMDPLVDNAPISPVPQNVNSGNFANPYGPIGYNPMNPYNAAINPQQQPFNPALSDAEKSFLQSSSGQIGTHQHTLPQPLPLPSSQQTISSANQPITQPKLVAQQQLTANPNPGNIQHNVNYGPYSNPYTGIGNPYGGYPTSGPYPNPNAPYPGGLSMAASQQYPMTDPMGASNLGAMNYDYLNDAFLY